MGAKPSKKSGSNKSRTPSSEGLSSDDETDGNVEPRRNSQKHRKDKKMPLFRSQSEKAKKRQQHMQYLAQENPEPVFDLSNCEMQDIPSGVFAICRVLQKEVLLLNDNWLGSINSGGSVQDLASIRVLDLHNNELKSLPDEITQLQSLQVLNLESNRLKKLPSDIGNLQCLQTLNVKNNKLKELPGSVCSMKSLRMLDLQENDITMLPRQLCHVRTMETLALDIDKMRYPPPGVCSSGTEEIMKLLCSECGLEYLPPSNFLLEVLDPPKIPTTSSNNSRALVEEQNLAKSLAGYSDMMEKRRQELIEIEREFADHQEAQAQLALMAQANREQMIQVITAEENKLDEQIEQVSREKEEIRRKLVQDLRTVEKGADNLIQQLLEMNAKAKKTEALMDAIEEQRIIDDHLFEVRWEEIQNLRKKEVLSAMESILKESENFEMLRQTYTIDKEQSLQTALVNDEMMANAQIASVLHENERQTNLLVADLAKQEALQKEAFEALQLQKDIKSQRITSEIVLIQEELASLTAVEVERRGFRAEEEMNRLAEKRIALIELLSQLMDEQDKRQMELKRRLEEMEQQKEDGQADYWLVQYQRLMDQKPQSLIDREQNLEISVVKILNKSHAEDYIPKFARHRITIETLQQLTDDHLKQMGVHEVGVRQELLKNIQEYKAHYKSKWDQSMEDFNVRTPTAPPADHPAPAPLRESSVIARGLNSECSICLDNQSDVIFMNCGHVCSCSQCCEKVQECPLCRAQIVRRIKLMSAQC